MLVLPPKKGCWGKKVQNNDQSGCIWKRVREAVLETEATTCFISSIKRLGRREERKNSCITISHHNSILPISDTVSIAVISEKSGVSFQVHYWTLNVRPCLFWEFSPITLAKHRYYHTCAKPDCGQSKPFAYRGKIAPKQMVLCVFMVGFWTQVWPLMEVIKAKPPLAMKRVFPGSSKFLEQRKIPLAACLANRKWRQLWPSLPWNHISSSVLIVAFQSGSAVRPTQVYFHHKHYYSNMLWKRLCLWLVWQGWMNAYHPPENWHIPRSITKPWIT